MKKETVKKLLQLNYTLYENQAQSFSDTRREIWEKTVIDFAKKIKPGSSLLDLGCGNGRLLQFLNSKVKTQNEKPQFKSEKLSEIKYLGVDTSKNLIKINQKKYPKARFEVGDGLKNPLFAGQRATDKFDYVISLAVLHHIPSENLQLKFLENIYRALKDRGQMIVSVWNRHQARYKKYFISSNSKSKALNPKPFDYAQGRQIKIDFRGLDQNDLIVPWRQSGYFRYIHAFTLKELSDLAQKVGFKNIQCFYANKYGKTDKKNGLNIYLLATK